MDARDYRLHRRSWTALSDLEQRAVDAAASLAMDSAHIPIIAAEILSKFAPERKPEHPEPDYSI